MKMKMKSRSHRYDINRPESRHGYRYIKYEKCLPMMMLICIIIGMMIHMYANMYQHLTNVWTSIHGKVKQHWGWVKKSAAYKKMRVLGFWIFQGYTRFWIKYFMIDVRQYYEYALDSKYTRGLNILGLHMVLNKVLRNRYLTGLWIDLEFWICQCYTGLL